MDDPPPPYQLNMDERAIDNSTKRRRFSSKKSTQSTPEQQRGRSHGPRLNVVTNFSKPPALADRAASYEKKVKQDWQAGVASITEIKAAIALREGQAGKRSEIGDRARGSPKHVSKPSEESVLLKSRVNSLRRPPSQGIGLSPSDRLVNIGLSITPTSMEKYVLDQSQSPARQRGLTVDQHSASDVRSVAPSIVVTPAGEQAPWSDAGSQAHTAAGTGPSPSVYSQPWTTPGQALWPSDAPPMPQIPPEALKSKQATRAIPSDVHVSDPSLKKLSVYTAFEEDESPDVVPVRRPESGDSQLRILKRSSTESIATKHRSQGWWNTVTSPFWPRSPLAIPKPLRIGKQPVKASAESPRETSPPNRPPLNDSGSAGSEHTSIWTGSPDEVEATSRSVDVNYGVGNLTAMPHIVEDPLPPEGFGLAADYYQACWHDMNSPTAYFPCQNHVCGPNNGPTTQDAIENFRTGFGDSRDHTSMEKSLEDPAALHQIAGNRFSAAFSEAVQSRQRPTSDATIIEDLDATPVIEDAHVAPIIRGVAPMNAKGPEIKSRGPPPPVSKDTSPPPPQTSQVNRLGGSASPSEELNNTQRSQERLAPEFQRGLGLSNREEPAHYPSSGRSIGQFSAPSSSPPSAAQPSRGRTESIVTGPPVERTMQSLPSRADSLVHIVPQTPIATKQSRKQMIAILPPGHPLNKSPAPASTADERSAPILGSPFQPGGRGIGQATYHRPTDRNPFDQRDYQESRKSRVTSLFLFSKGGRDRGRTERIEPCEKGNERRKCGGLSSLKALMQRGHNGSPAKQPVTKRKKWAIIAIAAGLLFMIILIIVLAMTLHHKGDDQEVQTEWLNITGFPPVPTGVSTIVQPDAVRASSGCVEPSTLWSCAVPKEQQDAIAPNDADQPNFRVEIRFRNDSSFNISGTSNATFARRDAPLKPLSAKAFVRSRILSARDSFTNLLFTPMPAAPRQEEQVFLGQNTDGNVAPFDGEETPFFMSFENSDKLPARLRKRASPEPTATSLVPSSSSSSDPFPDITSNIPKPDVNPDGTAAPANLLPYPSAQPLRLFNRGKDTEHYGFYTYFDRSIFLKSTALVNSSTVTEVPTDKNGGAEEDAATVRCTWTQTRFLVQIWTNQGNQAQLLPASNNTNTTGANGNRKQQPKTLSDSSANNFTRPGSFPYPVSITLDRHGGDIKSKEIYCYGIDERQRVIESAKKIQLENRAFGGKLINPALGPFGDVKVSKKEGGPGGIDGGTGGCGCLWRNWQGAGGS